ncbi:MAG: DUF2380 domain-containing protein [Gemmatimonadales bacterium]
MIVFVPRLTPLVVLMTIAVAAPVPVVRAQAPGSGSGRPPGLEAPSAPVAVFPASLYNDQANVREATDSVQAAIATDTLRRGLRKELGNQVIDYAAVDSAAQTPTALAAAGGIACHLRVACAVAVGRALGARWVVLAKVSKTSNLIWLLSAQLVRVPTGDIVLDDSTELKGDPSRMVRLGAGIFADRVVRTVRNGGVATNFPNTSATP